MEDREQSRAIRGAGREGLVRQSISIIHDTATTCCTASVIWSAVQWRHRCNTNPLSPSVWKRKNVYQSAVSVLPPLDPLVANIRRSNPNGASPRNRALERNPKEPRPRTESAWTDRWSTIHSPVIDKSRWSAWSSLEDSSVPVSASLYLSLSVCLSVCVAWVEESQGRAGTIAKREQARNGWREIGERMRVDSTRVGCGR